MENHAVETSYPELYRKVTNSTNTAARVPDKVGEGLLESLQRDTYRSCWWAIQDLPPGGELGCCGTFLELPSEAEDPEPEYRRQTWQTWAAKYVRDWEVASKPASRPPELSSPNDKECAFRRSVGATAPDAHDGFHQRTSRIKPCKLFGKRITRMFILLEGMEMAANHVSQKTRRTKARKLPSKRTTGRFILWEDSPRRGSRSLHYSRALGHFTTPESRQKQHA